MPPQHKQHQKSSSWWRACFCLNNPTTSNHPHPDSISNGPNAYSRFSHSNKSAASPSKKKKVYKKKAYSSRVDNSDIVVKRISLSDLNLPNISSRKSIERQFIRENFGAAPARTPSLTSSTPAPLIGVIGTAEYQDQGVPLMRDWTLNPGSITFEYEDSTSNDPGHDHDIQDDTAHINNTGDDDDTTDMDHCAAYTTMESDANANFSTENLKPKRPVVLGRGSYGAVYKGLLDGNVPVAIKLLGHGADAEAAFLKEADVLMRLNAHDNIVSLHGVVRRDDFFLLVMELMAGGDLYDALGTDRGVGALQWKRYGKGIALDFVRGVIAMHGMKITHRDLKSKNILLSSRVWEERMIHSEDDCCEDRRCEELMAKVADVGMAALSSRSGVSARSSSNKLAGTMAWSAPELILGEKCGTKSDIFSIGIVLWEIATGKVPHRGYIQLPEESERCPKGLIELISWCTQLSPTARPTAQQIYDTMLEI